VSINYQRTREMTIDELLLENRVVFLIGEITPASAARVTMQMLYLENQKKSTEIHFYVNSPGGVVDDTLAIYDTMQFISSPVSTYCMGRAYSGGSLLLGGITGQAEDIRIQAEQIIKDKNELIKIMAHHTGQTPERIRTDGERDKYFTAEEAKAYGLVDEVINFKPKV
jgi:ATP-dependent Clp protease, protease subunit